MLTFESHSDAETQSLGRKIARALRPGDAVALLGPLGAGKTTLVKGLAEGLGVSKDHVASPTFVLVHEYDGRCAVFHMDWYRLDSLEGLDELSIEEYFNNDSIVIVEWADKAPHVLPHDHLMVNLTHEGEDHRKIHVSANGKRGEEILKALS